MGYWDGIGSYPRLEHFYCEACEAEILAGVEIRIGSAFTDGAFVRIPLGETMTIMRGCSHIRTGSSITD